MALQLHPDLDQIMQDSGATAAFTQYLLALHILTTDVMALISPDEQHFLAQIITPFINKVSVAGVDYQSDINEHSSRAILLHIRSTCVDLRNAKQARATAALLQGVQPPQPPAQPPTASTTTVPKTLAPGVWHQQIKKYTSVQLHGVDREFPSTQLLGAESVLARLLHEHTSSKQYTPLKLGEILQARAYTSPTHL